jgi:hypothetical protein
MASITTTSQKKKTMMPGMAYPATVLALATAISYPLPRDLFGEIYPTLFRGIPRGRMLSGRAGYRARAPIGSQAGSTIGSASRARCRSAGSALLRAAISKTYWPNQESFIV